MANPALSGPRSESKTIMSDNSAPSCGSSVLSFRKSPTIPHTISLLSQSSNAYQMHGLRSTVKNNIFTAGNSGEGRVPPASNLGLTGVSRRHCITLLERSREMRGAREACGEADLGERQQTLIEEPARMFQPHVEIGGAEARAQMLREEPVKVALADADQCRHRFPPERLFEGGFHVLQGVDQDGMMDAIAFGDRAALGRRGLRDRNVQEPVADPPGEIAPQPICDQGM